MITFPFQTTPAPSNDELRPEPLNLKSERSKNENNHQSETTEDSRMGDANDRNVRSAKTCGSCQCTEKSSDEVELISCNIKQGFIEILNIDYGVADLTQLVSKQTGKQVDILIKDTILEMVKGLESTPYIRNLIMENNANLKFELKQPTVVVENLNFRTNAFTSFDKKVFQAKQLTLSNLMTSSMSDFASDDEWMSLGSLVLVIEGEMSDVQPFYQHSYLENVTILNTFSKKSEIIPDNFLEKAGRLSIVRFSNTSQASLPPKFSSRNGAKDVSFVLNVNNIRQRAFDLKTGVKSLNGITLTDSQKDISTSASDFYECVSFCASNDCRADADEVSRINCAICVRNKEGANNITLENDLCNFKPITSPNQLPSTVSRLHFLVLASRR